MGLSSQDRLPTHGLHPQQPLSTALQSFLLLLRISPALHDSNSKEPPPSSNLPGYLTLCYVPERSEVMREDLVAPGPSPANLT